MYVCSAARLLALYALVLGSTYGTLVASDVLLSRWTSSLDEEEEEGEAGGAVRWLYYYLLFALGHCVLIVRPPLAPTLSSVARPHDARAAVAKHSTVLHPCFTRGSSYRLLRPLASHSPGAQLRDLRARLRARLALAPPRHGAALCRKAGPFRAVPGFA